MAKLWRSFVMMLLSLSLLLSLLAVQGEGARILFYIGGISSHSHRVSVQPLANKLAERGHQVTFLSPLGNSASHPSIKEFSTAQLKGFNEVLQSQFGVVGLQTRLKTKFANDLLAGTALSDAAYAACSALLTSPELKPWIPKQKFDLVIIDSVCNECAFGLAYLFKAKTMLFGPISSVMPWDADLFGFPSESSWVPAFDTNYEGTMGYRERFVNTWTNLRWAWIFQNYHLPRLDHLVRDSLGVNDMPPLLDVVRNTSLMLLNQHFSDQFARSFPPFVVQVGGMHLQESRKPLPPEMEKFIQGAGDNGFIYISFGSVVKISAVPASVIQSFFDAIRNSTMRFFWKWEGDVPADAPKNVYFESWFPQQDILAHPKIKGYVMQGGQISVQQAICNGVPMIVFPVNGDQDLVAKRIRHERNGIEMELANVTANSLQESFEKLVSDSSYSRRAKELALVCKDRPMSAVDTAVWWTEYVLRMKDTSHLKPLSMTQNLLVYRSLDVFGFIFFVLFIFLAILASITYCILKFCLSSKHPSVVEKAKRS